MNRTNVVPLLPADFREADMMQFARDQLALVRNCNLFGGDPFGDETMHTMVRWTIKYLAEEHERNAARFVDLALAGAEDAAEALKDLIAERNTRNAPLGPALGTFATILADRQLNYRQAAVRPRQSFLENFVIICLIIALMRQFPRLKLRRSKPTRPSAFSIMSAVLVEAGLGRGSEEGIKKIWDRYGPPVNPGFNRAWNPKS